MDVITQKQFVLVDDSHETGEIRKILLALGIEAECIVEYNNGTAALEYLRDLAQKTDKNTVKVFIFWSARIPEIDIFPFFSAFEIFADTFNHSLAITVEPTLPGAELMYYRVRLIVKDILVRPLTNALVERFLSK